MEDLARTKQRDKLTAGQASFDKMRGIAGLSATVAL